MKEQLEQLLDVIDQYLRELREERTQYDIKLPEMFTQLEMRQRKIFNKVQIFQQQLQEVIPFQRRKEFKEKLQQQVIIPYEEVDRILVFYLSDGFSVQIKEETYSIDEDITAL